MKENFKCWIFGNLITLNTGCFVMIFILFNIYYKFLKVPANYFFYIVILLMPPFLCALILKYIKKDISFLYYSSIGWFYGIFLMLFLRSFSFFIENYSCRGTFMEDTCLTFSFELKYLFNALPSTFVLLSYIILAVSFVSFTAGVVTKIAIMCKREEMIDVFENIFTVGRKLAIIGCLMPVLILSISFIRFFYFSPVSYPGWEVSEPQLAYCCFADNFFRDLRFSGSGVSLESCGIKKEDSIKEATDTTLMMYGDFDGDDSSVELVKYYVEHNRYIKRVLYGQSGTGSESAWTEILQEKVLIGSSSTELTDIRLAEDPPGFELSYYTPPKIKHQLIHIPSGLFTYGRHYSDEGYPCKLDSGQIGEEERKQIRYVSVHIGIMYKGKLCLNKYCDPIELRFLDKPE